MNNRMQYGTNFKAAFYACATTYGCEPYLSFHDDDRDVVLRWTYRKFAEDTCRLISLLRSYGVRPGDRVAIVSQNRPEVLLTYFACWLMGACACPISADESSARKAFILRAAGSRLCLAEEAYVDAITALRSLAEAPNLKSILVLETLLDDLKKHEEALVQEADPEDGAFLVYTSGTTGDPKGILLSQRNLLSNALATADWHGLQPGDGMMTVLPIHHVNGAIVTGLTSFLAGGRNILNRRFSSETFWCRVESERVAITSMVPTLLEFLLEADEDIVRSSMQELRYLLCGAGPLLSETVLRFERRFEVPVCHGFGMSETTAYNTQFPMIVSDEERRHWYRDYGPPSVGCALSCNEVAVLRPDGSEADALEKGELAVRGPTVMAGYHDNPKASESAFKHGWFLSGDQAFYQSDASGRRFFFISGRIKELIIRGGVNISPLYIDEVLRAHPKIAYAVAFPFENKYYGEEIAAYVVPRPDSMLSELEVLRFVQDRLPHAQCPKVIIFGDEVPFTATGKPKRVQLAHDLAGALTEYRNVQFRDSKLS